jgi:hypothetical protein
MFDPISGTLIKVQVDSSKGGEGSTTTSPVVTDNNYLVHTEGWGTRLIPKDKWSMLSYILTRRALTPRPHKNPLGLEKSIKKWGV